MMSQMVLSSSMQSLPPPSKPGFISKAINLEIRCMAFFFLSFYDSMKNLILLLIQILLPL